MNAPTAPTAPNDTPGGDTMVRTNNLVWWKNTAPNQEMVVEEAYEIEAGEQKQSVMCVYRELYPDQHNHIFQ